MKKTIGCGSLVFVALLAGCSTPDDKTPAELARVYAIDSSGAIAQADVLLFANASAQVPGADTQYANNIVPGATPGDDIGRVSPMPASYASLRLEFTRPLGELFADDAVDHGIFAPKGTPDQPFNGGSVCKNSKLITVTNTRKSDGQTVTLEASTCYSPSSSLGGGPSVTLILGNAVQTDASKPDSTFQCSQFVPGGVSEGDVLNVTFKGLMDSNGNALALLPITVRVGTALDLLYSGYSDPDVGFTKLLLKGENAKGFLKDLACDAKGTGSGCTGSASGISLVRADLSSLDVVFSLALDGTKMGFSTDNAAASGDAVALAYWFSLLDADNQNKLVDGAWSIDATDWRIVHFAPTAGLLEGKHKYTLKITSGASAAFAGPPPVLAGTQITDQAGGTLAKDYTVSFLTAEAGVTPLKANPNYAVVSVVPDNGNASVDPRATGLSGNGTIDLLFPDSVDADSVKAALKIADSKGTQVAGTTTLDVSTDDAVSHVAQVAHFTPTADADGFALQRDTSYTVNLTGAKYASANVKSAIPDFTSQFITAPLQAKKMTCAAAGCKNRAANVPVTDSAGAPVTAITVTFNGKVDASTLTKDSLNLNTGTPGSYKQVAGQSVAAGSAPTSAVITLGSALPLTYTRTYTVFVDTSIAEDNSKHAKLHATGCDPAHPGEDLNKCAITFTFSTADFKLASASGGGSEIALKFTGPVDDTSTLKVNVSDVAGTTVAIGTPTFSGATVTVPTNAALKANTKYLVQVSGANAAKLGSFDPKVTAVSATQAFTTPPDCPPGT